MNLLLQIASNEPHFPYAAVAVMGIGFVAAVTIGSVAWYNSKRPPGWEDKERPDIVPEIEK
ncbi:MAG: hypothetical protein RLZZ381_3468 [Cyanobacteriota bacterium]|jgi:hypothetical protein|nr:hypothetical protein [Pleurocapsa minor HA4230-MV1]